MYPVKRIVCLITVLTLSLTLTGCKTRKTRFVTIGTGAVTGLYYPTGGAIARMINKKSDTYGIKATVESTGGSVFNINAVLSGDLEFGVAQSDRQFQAFNGLAEWTDRGPQTDLRSVFAVHPESVTLVASVDSGIREIADIKGKRVNLGNPGSGHLGNALDILEALNLTEDDINAEHVKPVEAPGLLQDERIDAFFFTVGHPNGNITESTSGRIKVLVVPIRGPGITEIRDKHPYYRKSIIPRDLYPSARNTEDIETIGVTTTIVTSSTVSDDLVYAITKEVFDNFDEFKTLHPAYNHLTKEDMLTGLFAPIHPGALKYYRESGLEQYIDPALITE